MKTEQLKHIFGMIARHGEKFETEFVHEIILTPRLTSGSYDHEHIEEMFMIASTVLNEGK